MKRRNPLRRRLLAREPTFAQELMKIARAVPRELPSGLEVRAKITTEALKLRRLELANPSLLAGEGPAPATVIPGLVPGTQKRRRGEVR